MLSTRELSNLRTQSGCCLYALRRAAEASQSDDPYIVIGYAIADELAVEVDGNRHDWNMAQAQWYRDKHHEEALKAHCERERVARASEEGGAVAPPHRDTRARSSASPSARHALEAAASFG